MIRLLISGSNGYIGLSFIKWAKEKRLDFQIETISLRDDTWKSKDFSNYDVIVHLAGIVHSPSAPSSLYYEVNRDLTVDFAIKAKKQGVKHFIFFSTLSVYGINNGRIKASSHPKPLTDYGKSKLEAEKELKKIEGPSFKLTILRPPMVYGPNCPGNFSKLVKMFYYLPVFPKVENKRSMIFIDNLIEFLNIIIQKQIIGTYIPQNNEYISTASIFKILRRKNCKMSILFPFFIPGVLVRNNQIINKLFGDLTVDREMSTLPFEYHNITFEESIINSGKVYVNHE